MTALKLLAAILIAAAPVAPDKMVSHEATLYEDDLALVDRGFDAASFKAARDAYVGPHKNPAHDDYTQQRNHLFADALLRISSFYESTTYELYPHRPLDRAAAFQFAAPMLVQSPFAKGLPAKPSKATPRSIEWEAAPGASYTLTYALDARGRVVKITLDWGV